VAAIIKPNEPASVDGSSRRVVFLASLSANKLVIAERMNAREQRAVFVGAATRMARAVAVRRS
jgi:hypothetical protein